MKQPDFEGAWHYAQQRLEKELDPRLTYHSIYHTRDDVVPAAERLAVLEGITGDDLLMLRTGGFFHDIGFVQQRSEHEAVSVGITAEVLPWFGFTPEQVEQICSMILATRLPQEPRNPLEEILTDADLDNLGREDFFEVSRRLRQEMANYNIIIPDKDWYKRQLEFITGHKYFTKAGNTLRNAQKEKNIEDLKELIKGLGF
jgi:uncharacterized protein